MWIGNNLHPSGCVCSNNHFSVFQRHAQNARTQPFITLVHLKFFLLMLINLFAIVRCYGHQIFGFWPKLPLYTFSSRTQRLGIFDEDGSVAMLCWMLLPCCRLYQTPPPSLLLLLLLRCLLSASYSQQTYTGQHGEKQQGGGGEGGGGGWSGRRRRGKWHCEPALQLWPLRGFADSFPQVAKQQLNLATTIILQESDWFRHSFGNLTMVLIDIPQPGLNLPQKSSMCLPHLGQLHQKSSLVIQVISLCLSVVLSLFFFVFVFFLSAKIKIKVTLEPNHLSWHFFISFHPTVNPKTHFLVPTIENKPCLTIFWI